MNVKCLQALNDEVDRLLKASFIRETLFSRLIRQPSPGEKEKEEVESLHQLYRFE